MKCCPHAERATVSPAGSAGVADSKNRTSDGRSGRRVFQGEAESADIYGLIHQHSKYAASMSILKPLFAYHAYTQEARESGDGDAAETRPFHGHVEERAIPLHQQVIMPVL